MRPEAPTLPAVRRHLSQYRYRFVTEAQLQSGIAGALTKLPIEFEREYRATERDRFDFWIAASGIVIETKIGGSVPTVAEQLQRYALLPEVLGILLITSRSNLRAMPDMIGGKPVRVLYLSGSML